MGTDFEGRRNIYRFHKLPLTLDDLQDDELNLADKIFLDDPKTAKAENAPKPGIPGPIHLVRRGDYLCMSRIVSLVAVRANSDAGGLIREYEENRRMLIEQQAVIASMPVKEGFGYDHPPLPVAIASSSKVRSVPMDSPAVSASGKGKRRKTPEFTDSEDESG